MQDILDKETISLLRYLHGGFNLLMALSVWLMLGLGLRVRRLRATGRPTLRPGMAHMRLGPVLAVLCPMGFFAGATLMLLDRGRLMYFPAHFIVGLLLALALPCTFLIARAMLGGNAAARPWHRRLGISIGALYLVQVFLGLGALL